MIKENAYAICTAQKKKSGMGHDAWKRCVDKIKKEESVMNFKNRLITIIEKKKLKEEDPTKTTLKQARIQQRGVDSDDEEEAETGQAVESMVKTYKAKKKKGVEEADGDTSTMDKMAQDKRDAGFGELDDKDKAAIQKGVDTAREKEAARKAALNASKKSKTTEATSGQSKRPFSRGGSLAHDDRNKSQGAAADDIPHGTETRKKADAEHVRKTGKCIDGSQPPCGEDEPESKTEAKKDDKWIQKAMGRVRDRKVKAKDEN